MNNKDGKLFFDNVAYFVKFLEELNMLSSKINDLIIKEQLVTSTDFTNNSSRKSAEITRALIHYSNGVIDKVHFISFFIIDPTWIENEKIAIKKPSILTILYKGNLKDNWTLTETILDDKEQLISMVWKGALCSGSIKFGKEKAISYRGFVTALDKFEVYEEKILQKEIISKMKSLKQQLLA